MRVTRQQLCPAEPYWGLGTKEKNALLILTVFKFFISYHNFCIDFDGQEILHSGNINQRECNLRGPQINTKTWLYSNCLLIPRLETRSNKIVQIGTQKSHPSKTKKKYYIQICLA